ncbi:Metallothiol transferase FosB 2 [Hartmannibacter diazotrophicus]|uniref:Metallothiol transferase FosB 2 n=1 Tax=Hartmannibacter diazotrophicus TaxID=1482074 RepID=A0A2C9D417_9HYPH|nr:VOC family protein [Hartmannibacter diazotrophicus]SON55052.1 Metallothiol transferase FosB 2 [Hartmannibacter diazotrophicus]
MTQLPPVRALFEAHLTVQDLDRSIAFYRDVMGLPLAHIVSARNVAFFWVPREGEGMLGLWGVGTAPVSIRSHVAFRLDLEDVEHSVEALRAAGLTPVSFGREIDEPDVLTWMPAASVYFDDPDGHQLEYIAMLEQAPRPDLRRMPLSQWRTLHAEEGQTVRTE